MQSKQKLSDDEKTTLINFYKENKAFWSSEVNFRNKEEKSAVKEQLLTLFEGKYSEGFLDKNFHALRTAFSREHKKYKGNPSKKKWKFYDQLSFLTEELEKEKKVTFDLEEKEILIDFFNSNPPLWNHHLSEYRDRSLRDSLLEKLVNQFDGKFTKEDVKREWHNLQTVYKREKSREESSKVSGSGSCDVYCSTWELFSQMEFLEVTGDIDTSYTSLDSGVCAPQAQKNKKPSRTAEDDAKTELWKSIAASLKPQDNFKVKSELSESASLFGKVVADFLMQYDPTEWCYLKKKVMDVFFEYEQQKSSSSRSSYPNHTSYLPNQFIQGNPFQPGHFMNMVNVSNHETP